MTRRCRSTRRAAALQQLDDDQRELLVKKSSTLDELREYLNEPTHSRNTRGIIAAIRELASGLLVGSACARAAALSAPPRERFRPDDLIVRCHARRFDTRNGGLGR